MKRVIVIHGPNLNLLGQRDHAHYGQMTLDEIAQTLSDKNLTEVREDIIFFLNDLVKRGFIEILNKDF